MRIGKSTRREILVAGGIAAVTLPTFSNAETIISIAKTNPSNLIVPINLNFDPKNIKGLSERLLTSHHDNNYVGAVNRLNAISNEFKSIDVSTAKNYQINGLKREELIAWNSMILHEIYFSSIGAPNSPSSELLAAIVRDFGSEARWRAEFVAMGKALGGGSGWVVLVWSQRDKRLVNQWAADHTMSLARGIPLLALDMYEHAYALDYGAKASTYVDAFMSTINWQYASSEFGKIV